MQVSVIIPNYNHSKFLQQRIDSVLHQTYQDFEVIILDDCSTDNSREIIEPYRHHPKVNQVVYNEHNSGSTFKQWKKGIELAQGEWIWMAESDDWCELELLSSLVDNIKKCPATVLSYCQSFETDAKGNVKGYISRHVEDLDVQHWKNDFCNNGIDEIKSYLIYINTIPNASAVLFKKSAYEQADESFVDMKFCGDWLLWIQLLKHGNIAFCAQPLNYFRQHEATTRVLDSYIKKKKRLEEEYKIIAILKNSVAAIEPSRIEKRLQYIVSGYSSYFTKKEIIKSLVNPSSYNKTIPLKKTLFSYFKNKIGLHYKS